MASSSREMNSYDTGRPGTPYPFEKSELMSAESSPSSDFLNESRGLGAKRRRLQNEEHVDVGPIDADPHPHFEHQKTRLRYNISPTELMTASRSIISQVNWSDVVLDVLGRERPAFYRDAFEKILRLHVEELLKPKDTGESNRNHHEGKDQRSSSTIEGTEEVASNLHAISTVTAYQSSNMEQQGNYGSLVDIITENSISEGFDDQDEEDDVNKIGTNQGENGEDEDEDCEEG